MNLFSFGLHIVLSIVPIEITAKISLFQLRELCRQRISDYLLSLIMHIVDKYKNTDERYSRLLMANM